MNRKLKTSELGRISIEEFKKKAKIPIIVVLDNIRSLNNIGSFFRTSDALNIEAIYLCGITATPPHREIQKTALGATNSVDWKYYKNTAQAVTELKNKGYAVYGIEQTENPILLQDFKYNNQPLAIVFGNEVAGVEQDVIDLTDGCIEIPQFGTKHSFNVSVSGGIVLWDLVKQTL